MESNSNTALRILLADDDRDDRHFFSKALKEIDIPSQLQTLENGELLMTHLLSSLEPLPDVLFLDLNMPRKNGASCLSEIKASAKLRSIPIIIYSTSLHADVADLLYNKGAQNYIRKTEFPELVRILTYILERLSQNKLTTVPREEFVINVVEA